MGSDGKGGRTYDFFKELTAAIWYSSSVIRVAGPKDP